MKGVEPQKFNGKKESANSKIIELKSSGYNSEELSAITGWTVMLECTVVVNRKEDLSVNRYSFDLGE